MEVVTPPSTLVYQPHPLLMRGREVIEIQHVPGENMQQLFERSIPNDLLFDPRMVWVTAIDGYSVPAAMWGYTRPAPGMLITIKASAHGGGGGGGGGKNPMQAILSIGLMIVAPGIGAALSSTLGVAGTTFLGVSAGTILGGVVSILGNAIISRMFTADSPALSQVSGAGGASASVSPTYSLTGGSNQTRKYQPLPLVLGAHKIFPDNGIRTYTEFVDDDQILYQVFHFGFYDLGLALSEFKIGTTLLTDYADYTLEESDSSGALTLFPGNVDTDTGGVLTYAASWITKTSSLDCTGLAVEINGALYAIRAGAVSFHDVDIEIEYRLVGASSWTPFVGSSSTVPLHSASRKPLRRTFKLSVALGQYQVRVKRVLPDEVYDSYTSNLEWAQLRSYQPDTADYTGQKRVALRIKANDRLNGTIQELSAVASRTIPTWNGSAWVNAVSSNPAYICRYFAKGARIGGKVAFGGNLADSQIDDASIIAFASWCSTKSLTFNGIIDTRRTCGEVIDLVARCGRGRYTYATGKLGFVWDAPNLPVTAVFGLGNIKRSSFSVEYFSGDVPERVVGRFINPNREWTQDEVRADVPGVSVPSLEVVVDLFGFTDAAAAGKEVAMAAAAYSTNVRKISWETDLEGNVCTGGDVVVLAHDLTQWGKSGRILSGTGTVLLLDQVVTFTAGLDHYVRITTPNGFMNIYNVVNVAGDTDSITLQTALPSTDGMGNAIYTPNTDPSHPPMDWQWAFEPRATPGKKVKIIGAVPNGLTGWKFTAVDEDEEYYASESNTYASSNALTTEGPLLSDLKLAEHLVGAGSVYQVQLSLVWNAEANYELAIVKVKINGNDADVITHRTYGRRLDVVVPDTGYLSISIVGFTPEGKTSARSKIDMSYYSIVGKNYPPSNVGTVTASVVNEMLRLSWPAIVDADASQYEIRKGATWATATDPKFTSELFLDIIPTGIGAFTWLVKAIDTSGNPSTTATSVSFTLAAPPAPTVSTGFAGSTGVVSFIPGTSVLPIRSYEIRYGGSNWATATFLATLSALQYTLAAIWSGGRVFRVAATDIAGNVGAAGTSTLTVASPGSPTITGSFNKDEYSLSWAIPSSTLPVDYYEIRYGGASWAAAAFLTKVSSTALAAPALWLGSRTFWIAAVDIAGNVGAVDSVTLVVTAAVAPTISAQVVDNNVLLFWNLVQGSLPTATYEVRRGASWAAGTVIGTKSGGFTTVFETVAGAYTYWVAAIDTVGNYGTPGSTSTTVNQPPDYVLKASFDTTFSGTKSNMALDLDGIWLLPIQTGETWSQHFANNGWTTPQDQITAGFAIYVQPTLSSGYYEETYDYGAVLAANKITVTPNVQNVVGACTTSVDITVAQDAGFTTGVQSFPGQSRVYATSFRYVKYRITVTRPASTAFARLVGVNVRLDSKLKTITGTLACVSTDTGGTIYYLTDTRLSGGVKEFIDVDAIQVTPLATTSITAVYDFTDIPNPLSLKVLLFNSTTGARVSGPASLTIRGF